VLAIDVLRWPGVNQAFLFSFIVTTALALLAVPYAKRRPAGTPFTWGEAMVASVWTFGLMFLAFGVVPHQWIDHADKDLGWNKTKILYGPFDILKPKALGGNFPMTLQYEAIRDVIVVVIHLWFFGLIIYLWMMWQNRGKKAAAKSAEIATSAFGRPLVKKT
jgi:hypothetical protein